MQNARELSVVERAGFMLISNLMVQRTRKSIGEPERDSATINGFSGLLEAWAAPPVPLERADKPAAIAPGHFEGSRSMGRDLP